MSNKKRILTDFIKTLKRIKKEESIVIVAPYFNEERLKDGYYKRVKAIDEIWDQELDLSRRVLVELYKEITGEKLPWYDYKEPLVDSETVNDLEKLAEKNDVPNELIRNLLLSVYRNKNYSNQRFLRDGMDRLLNQQWLHYEIIEEIENENQ